ncbi:MAG: DUF2878 domain-containing protein [Chlamydiia bacterium]|nr:DUF2878 domain-containing protein [Chlamydiia bacterium]
MTRDQLLAHPLTYYVRIAFGMLSFYLVWFVCLWGAVQGRHYLGPLLVLGTIVIHCIISPQWRKDLAIIVLVSLSGSVLDSAYMALGMMEYATPNPLIPWLCPLWLTSLYALFAMTVDHSLAWIQRHWSLAVISGALGGAFSYIAGERVHAVHFLWSYSTVVVAIAIVWAIVTPSWLYMSRKIHRFFS